MNVLETLPPVTNPRVQLAAVEAELARRTLTTDLAEFSKHAWALVEPTEPLIWNWHLDELCRVLEQVERGELTQVIFNVPSGTMKSYLISVFFRAQLWAKNPALRFATFSYSQHLSLRDNQRLRTILQSEWFTRRFPKFEIAGDQNAKEKIETTKKGWSIASSVGGAAIGEHPDYIFIDDPITEVESRSKDVRDAVNTWVSRTISSRGVARHVKVLLCMQRFESNDPSGYLLKKGGGWHLVSFPMRYILSRAPTAEDPLGYTADPRDRRTRAGELLFPKLLNDEMVRTLELNLGPYGTASQLQQQPQSGGMKLFRRGWFETVDLAPKIVFTVRGWDTGGTDTGDETASVKIGVDVLGTYYVLDVITERAGPHDVDTLIKETTRLDGTDVSQREEKEPGSAGLAIINARTRQLPGYDYAGVPTTGDKVTRARGFRAQCEARNVKVVRGAWNEKYLAELAEFPDGPDNQVDASSAAFNALVTERPRHTTAVWGRR